MRKEKTCVENQTREERPLKPEPSAHWKVKDQQHARQRARDNLSLHGTVISSTGATTVLKPCHYSKYSKQDILPRSRCCEEITKVDKITQVYGFYDLSLHALFTPVNSPQTNANINTEAPQYGKLAVTCSTI